MAVIREDVWQSQFAGSPAMLGRVTTINGKQVTIVGVVKRGYWAPDSAVIWLAKKVPR